MRSATVSKWLQENANAPPPPATPAGLPDDSASTVYPESSVSNPYASRYTGSRHRAGVMQHVPQYLDRRPTSAQAHRRDRDHYPQYAAPATRHRQHSFSAETRYVPAQAQPYNYAYAQPQPQSARQQMYYTPQQPAQGGYGRGTPPRIQSVSHHNLATTRTSPTRVDAVRPQVPQRAYTYNYASTPTITLQSRAAPMKKAPFLRRLFGIDWGSPKPVDVYPTRNSSRSSSKSKSHRSDSKSYHDASYRATSASRPRRNSEGIVYLRY